MLKTVTREITLFVQARSGLSTSATVSAIVIVAALLVAFAFLCVAACAWLAIQFGTVFAGLIMAGVFVVIAIIAAIVCATARRSGAFSLLALRSESSRRRGRSRSHNRVAAHRASGVARFPRCAMGPRIPRQIRAAAFLNRRQSDRRKRVAGPGQSFAGEPAVLLHLAH